MPTTLSNNHELFFASGLAGFPASLHFKEQTPLFVCPTKYFSSCSFVEIDDKQCSRAIPF
jgi:hypothetical protein